MSRKTNTVVRSEPALPYTTAADSTHNADLRRAAFTNAELLQYMLSISLEESTSLIREHGGLRALAEVNPVLADAMEFSRRVMLEELQRSDVLTSPALTRQYVRARLRDYKREVFLCLFLDNQHRVIAHEELFFGTIDGSMVHPREVVCRSIKHNAAALIFVHNHPSGVPEPSQADISLTRRLKNALALLDIRTLDHLIVGDSEVVSLAERGLL